MLVANFFIETQKKILSAHKYHVECYNRIIEDLKKTDILKKQGEYFTSVSVLRPPSVEQKILEERPASAATLYDGGKSRRRHRRGRTLHKRRKSRKVRKTKCRRK